MSRALPRSDPYSDWPMTLNCSITPLCVLAERGQSNTSVLSLLKEKQTFFDYIIFFMSVKIAETIKSLHAMETCSLFMNRIHYKKYPV